MTTFVNVQDMQQVELVVQGPDDINRMYITTGTMHPNKYINDNTSGANGRYDEQTYAALIDPALPVGAFRRAIVVASLSDVALSISNIATSQQSFRWNLKDSQADYDDESGKVQLMVTPFVYARGDQNATNLNAISFQVTTLASLPQT